MQVAGFMGPNLRPFMGAVGCRPWGLLNLAASILLLKVEGLFVRLEAPGLGGPCLGFCLGALRAAVDYKNPEDSVRPCMRSSP